MQLLVFYSTQTTQSRNEEPYQYHTLRIVFTAGNKNDKPLLKSCCKNRESEKVLVMNTFENN